MGTPGGCALERCTVEQRHLGNARQARRQQHQQSCSRCGDGLVVALHGVHRQRCERWSRQGRQVHPGGARQLATARHPTHPRLLARLPSVRVLRTWMALRPGRHRRTEAARARGLAQIQHADDPRRPGRGLVPHRTTPRPRRRSRPCPASIPQGIHHQRPRIRYGRINNQSIGGQQR